MEALSPRSSRNPILPSSFRFAPHSALSLTPPSLATLQQPCQPSHSSSTPPSRQPRSLLRNPLLKRLHPKRLHPRGLHQLPKRPPQSRHPGSLPDPEASSPRAGLAEATPSTWRSGMVSLAAPHPPYSLPVVVFGRFSQRRFRWLQVLLAPCGFPLDSMTARTCPRISPESFPESKTNHHNLCSLPTDSPQCVA